MHQIYDDILRRIPEPPKWFDEAGVPRYDAFAPDDLASIYAQEAALAEVSCQACGTRFKVALTDAFADDAGLGLCDMIRLRRVRYGDPPNVGCCPAGPTMSSVMHAVLEYWSRDYEVSYDWVRDPAYEGPVAEGRLEPPDTVVAVLAAVGRPAGDGSSDRTGTGTSVRVVCTSRRNRYDIAGRIGAALAADGRVLVTFPSNYVVVARKMLDGLVPDHDVGHSKDGRRITLASFDHLLKVDLAAFDGWVVLAGPLTTNERSDAERAAAEAALAATPFGGARVELLLPHSRPVLGEPYVVIDAGGRSN